MIPGATTSLATSADTAAGVLEQVRADRAAADAPEARVLAHAFAWEALQPAVSFS